ncbi:hypothetical protein F4779DRAFT_580526 [Xylariaceae sp. FL0662B]|nr:hypothetical protein F4779DRAFT_580526 [Xylariaceae sp. FL0662B]
MAAALFYIARHRHCYDKLAAEIGGPELAACSYLRACIDETLRMSPPLPGMTFGARTARALLRLRVLIRKTGPFERNDVQMQLLSRYNQNRPLFFWITNNFLLSMYCAGEIQRSGGKLER